MRVKATIGKTTWNTSIFPDSESDSFVLPVKAEVRTKEDIGGGDAVTLTLDVMMGEDETARRVGIGEVTKMTCEFPFGWRESKKR